MSKLIVNKTTYTQVPYDDENEIEQVVVNNSELIFGNNTVYFDLKKGIRAHKEGVLTIPDGYLISFNGARPKLFVVENELASHDVYEHIGMHFLKYNSSFSEGSKTQVKNYLLEYVKENNETNKKIYALIKGTKFDNPSELLDYVIFENDYGFIVVIDEITEELNLVLKSFTPEIIELKKFTDKESNKIYLYDGFEEPVVESLSKSLKTITEVDTIVCPALEDGFKEVFLKQNVWYAIRISPTIIPQIKYIAIYEAGIKSRIKVRYYGEVDRIEKCARPGYKHSGKYEVILKGKPKKIGPIELTKNDLKKVPYSPRYTKFDLLKKAKTIGQIF